MRNYMKFMAIAFIEGFFMLARCSGHAQEDEYFYADESESSLLEDISLSYESPIAKHEPAQTIDHQHGFLPEPNQYVSACFIYLFVPVIVAYGGFELSGHSAFDKELIGHSYVDGEWVRISEVEYCELIGKYGTWGFFPQFSGTRAKRVWLRWHSASSVLG